MKTKQTIFQLALRSAYADKQGLIIAANRAYRAAVADGNSKPTETFRSALWSLLMTAGYVSKQARNKRSQIHGRQVLREQQTNDTEGI